MRCSPYRLLGDRNKFLEYSELSLVIARELKDKKSELEILRLIGNMYRRIAKYGTAIQYHQRGLEIAYSLTDASKPETVEVMAMLRELRANYLALGDEVKANEYDELHDLYFDRYMAQSVSENAESIDVYQQAESNLQEAREIGNTELEEIALSVLASRYWRSEDNKKAIPYYNDLLQIYRSKRNPRDEAETLNRLAGIYYSSGDTSSSIDYYKNSLEISLSNDIHLREYEDSFVPLGSIQSLAEIYANDKYYEKAIEYYSQALDIVKNGHSSIQFFEQHFLRMLGDTYSDIRDYDKAISAYQKILALKVRDKERAGEASVLDHIASFLEQQGKSQLAITFYKQAVEIYEDIRSDLARLPIEQQATYTKTIESTYRALADLLLQQDRILEAQQVLDLLKVQELEDYLQNTRSSDSGDLIILKPEQEILDRYQQLQTSAIEIGKELTQLRQLKTQQDLTPQQDQRLQDLLRLETDINRQFNRFIDSDPIQALLDQLSRKTLQRTLPLEDLNALRDNLRKTNAALIYPLILGDRLELILTTPDSPPIRRTVTNFDPAQLKQTIVAYRNALQSPNDLEGTKQLAQQLHDWLIAPLEADLAAANPDTLIYAPDGILRYIPLAALYDENQPEGKRWLAQRYATNNIVAKSLTEFDSTPADNPRVLAGAWGNQSHSIKAGDKTFNFSGIPFTLSEVESLAQLLPTEALLEQDFSRSNLTAKDLNSFNIIHLATHGKFVTGNAANSFLALGSGEAIPLPEIKNLSLSDVDLVVLSACETGVGGDFGQGEEILGLGYQFQRAGAKAALASLWQVDDGGTEALMSAFYAALSQGRTKAEALRAAQQALISGDYEAVGLKRAGVEVVSTRTGEVIGDRQLSHPYYWAPFILIGNGL